MLGWLGDDFLGNCSDTFGSLLGRFCEFCKMFYDFYDLFTICLLYFLRFHDYFLWFLMFFILFYVCFLCCFFTISPVSRSRQAHWRVRSWVLMSSSPSDPPVHGSWIHWAAPDPPDLATFQLCRWLAWSFWGSLGPSWSSLSLFLVPILASLSLS